MKPDPHIPASQRDTQDSFVVEADDGAPQYNQRLDDEKTWPLAAPALQQGAAPAQAPQEQALREGFRIAQDYAFSSSSHEAGSGRVYSSIHWEYAERQLEEAIRDLAPPSAPPSPEGASNGIMVALDKVDQFHAHAQPADAATLGPEGEALREKHWPDCALNHGGTICDMGPDCGTEGKLTDNGWVPVPDALRDEALDAEWLAAIDSWRKCSSKRLSWESGGHCSACRPLQRLMGRAVLRRSGRHEA